MLGVVFTGAELPRSQRRILDAGAAASARSVAAAAHATEDEHVDGLDATDPEEAA